MLKNQNQKIKEEEIKKEENKNRGEDENRKINEEEIKKEIEVKKAEEVNKEEIKTEENKKNNFINELKQKISKKNTVEKLNIEFNPPEIEGDFGKNNILIDVDEDKFLKKGDEIEKLQKIQEKKIHFMLLSLI